MGKGLQAGAGLTRYRRTARVCVGFSTLSLLIAALSGAPPGQPVEEGRKALDLLLAARYSEFSELLTAEAKEKLTLEVLRDRVGAEIKSFGTLQDVGEPRTMKSGSTDIVSFPVRFSNNRVNVQLNLDESGEITAISFRSPGDPLPQVWTRPIYSKPDLFQERDITVGADQWKLGREVHVPCGKGPFPAVVLVHGPGPNDWTSRFTRLGFSRILPKAWRRAVSRCFATTSAPEFMARRCQTIPFTLREETIEDAVRALAVTRRQPEVDPAGCLFSAIAWGICGPADCTSGRQTGGSDRARGERTPSKTLALAQTEFMLKAKGGASPEEQKRLELLKAQVAKVKPSRRTKIIRRP